MTWLALALVFVAVPLAEPGHVKDALDKVYAAGEYQTTLPAQDGPLDSATANPAAPEESWLGLELSAYAPLVRALLWAGLGTGVLLLLLWLARNLSFAEGDARDEAFPAAALPVLTRGPLQDAESLAAQGKFAEAIHVLLMRTFEALSRARLSPGWTSREVAENVPLADDARSALHELVATVERCAFAGLPASAEDYARCADRYRGLAQALSRGRA